MSDEATKNAAVAPEVKPENTQGADDANGVPVEQDDFNNPLLDDDQEEGDGKQAAEEGKGEPEKEKPKLPIGVEKSFARLTKQRTEAREALALALQENAKLRAQLQQPLKAREEYASEQEYIADAVERAVAQRELPKIEQQAQQAHAAYQDSLNSEWSAVESEAKSALPDYDTVVTGSKAPISEPVRLSLLESPVGPYVAYHLGKNPEELRYLNSATQREVDRYMSRLEYQIETNLAKAPKAQAAPVQQQEIPKAPAATPKAAHQAAAPAKRLEDLDGDAYLKAFRERQRAKRNRS